VAGLGLLRPSVTRMCVSQLDNRRARSVADTVCGVGRDACHGL